MIEITINGEKYSFERGLNLFGMLLELKLDPLKVAVERNLEIVPKTTYQNVKLAEGDRLEIVHFIGGGKNGGGNDFIGGNRYKCGNKL